MKATNVKLSGFTVVGYKIETNLEEFNSGIGKATYQKLLLKKDELSYKKHPNVLLLQIYPMKPDFDPWVDRYIQMLCYEVTDTANIPVDMIIHKVPEGNYVTCTHQGMESEMQRSYDFLYQNWMQKTGNIPTGFDFEIWDERYKPDSVDNEIDIYVSIK
ncbi:MAG: hypothetical protein K0R46_32 [Herbinix sp.]|nr:hypothetical protein [Herbinix sp.]